jgi:hypothetical protein
MRIWRVTITDRCAIAALAVGMLLHGSARAQDQLLPFRDPSQGQWGYKRPDGSVAIPPRYLGAGVFREGQAPVKDADGFAMIDHTGRIVQRIAVDFLSVSAVPIPPPADACAWSTSAPFPTTGFQCYVRQLRGSAAVIGGEITIRPSGGESSRSAVILKFPSGVVVVEDVGYEGFTRCVLLPGVSREQALQWRLKLYPDLPAKVGCSESWNVGVIRGGAFIEQRAGC